MQRLRSASEAKMTKGDVKPRRLEQGEGWRQGSYARSPARLATGRDGGSAARAR